MQSFAKLSQHYELKNNPKIKIIKIIYQPTKGKPYKLPDIHHCLRVKSTCNIKLPTQHTSKWCSNKIILKSKLNKRTINIKFRIPSSTWLYKLFMLQIDSALRWGTVISPGLVFPYRGALTG